MFMGPRNWFQRMNSASLCSLACRYDNPIPPRFLAPIDFLKSPALYIEQKGGAYNMDWKLKAHQIWSASPNGAEGICVPIYWRRSNFFGFTLHCLSLYLHLSSDISVSIISYHLRLLHHLYLIYCSVHLHLTPNAKRRSAPNSSVRIAYWHGNRLLNWLYLAYTEKEKKTEKLKENNPRSPVSQNVAAWRHGKNFPRLPNDSRARS